MRGAAGGHDLIETMRFDPEKGIELLELHLERMKASAAELGFSFDRHEARNRIQALCFELDDRASRCACCSRAAARLALEVVAAARACPMARCRASRCRCRSMPGDWRLRHKTTDRGFYEAALAVAKAARRRRSAAGAR